MYVFVCVSFVYSVSPLSARITQRERLVANQRHQIECIATGSRPQAMITWWMGSRQLTDVNILVMYFYFSPLISSNPFFLLSRPVPHHLLHKNDNQVPKQTYTTHIFLSRLYAVPFLELECFSTFFVSEVVGSSTNVPT